MMIDQDHHYVPIFFLKQWAGADGKVPYFWFKDGRIIQGRITPKNAAFETNLYAQDKVAQDQRHIYETKLFGTIDNGASKILPHLLREEPYQFTPETRTMWAAFLIASALRVPILVAVARESGQETLTNELDRAPEEFDAIKGTSPENTMREWVDKHLPGLIENFGLHSMASFITDYNQIKKVTDLHWSAHSIPLSKREFLTSDRPLMTFGLPENHDFGFVMPLGPRRIFIAAKSLEFADRIARSDQTAFAKKVNGYVVQRAQQRAYGRAELIFVKRALEGKAK